MTRWSELPHMKYKIVLFIDATRCSIVDVLIFQTMDFEQRVQILHVLLLYVLPMRIFSNTSRSEVMLSYWSNTRIAFTACSLYDGTDNSKEIRTAAIDPCVHLRCTKFAKKQCLSSRLTMISRGARK